MPSHYELRYWSNGVRRCDIYTARQEKAARAALDQLTYREHPTPALLNYVTTSENVEKCYRKIRKGTVTNVMEAEG